MSHDDVAREHNPPPGALMRGDLIMVEQNYEEKNLRERLTAAGALPPVFTETRTKKKGAVAERGVGLLAD